jgi:predicted TIM-barrel fold metal-dependent hydrolase
VREFLTKYQDRILYATDVGVTDENSEQRIESLGDQWKQDWDFFATADSLTSRKVDGKFRGLDLEAEVLRKIFSTNALQWYPGI